MKRVREQPSQVFTTRGARMISCTCAPLPDGVELVPQRMGGIDLVVPVGADQQQVLHVPLGQQVLNQVERGRVEPLQVVEKQRQRMLRSREHTDNRRNTSWKRRCASCGGSSGTGGCSPMMSFSSGTRSTMSRPFGPTASRSASRQLFSSASLLPRSWRIRL